MSRASVEPGHDMSDGLGSVSDDPGVTAVSDG